MPPRKRTLPPIEEALIPHPMTGKLPEAKTLLNLGLQFSEDELRSIRIAMSLWADSRKPKLTWAGWQHIGFAREIGRMHAARMKQPKKALTLFLRATGFTFINQGLNHSLDRCMEHLADINAWYKETLRRPKPNDPMNVWEQFNEDQDAKAVAPRKHKGAFRRYKRDFPTLLEDFLALNDKLELVEEQRDQLLTLIGEVRDAAERRKDEPGMAEIYQRIIERR